MGEHGALDGNAPVPCNAEREGIDRLAPTGKYVAVQTAGSASWRLEVCDSDLLEKALFVRDAVGLVVPPSADLPPVLDSPVTDRRSVLSDQDRAAAAVQWTPWWQQILELEFGAKRAPVLPSTGPRSTGVGAGVRTAGEPPEFTALAHVPQLQAAVRASFEDASQWQRRRTSRLEAALSGDVIKRAVDDVAFDRQVPVHALSGVVVLLPVTGPWWRAVAPGEVLCSEVAASSPDTNYQVVYEVFASSLDR